MQRVLASPGPRFWGGDNSGPRGPVLGERQAMARSASSGESSSSKSLFFMMAAIFCGFAILLSAGLLMTSRVIHALQLHSESDKTIVRTPLGDYRVEKAQEVGPGLPVYPQASLVLPGGGSVHLPVNQHQVLT